MLPLLAFILCTRTCLRLIYVCVYVVKVYVYTSTNADAPCAHTFTTYTHTYIRRRQVAEGRLSKIMSVRSVSIGTYVPVKQVN